MLTLQLRDLPLDERKPFGLALELGAQAWWQSQRRELLFPTRPADPLYAHVVHDEQVLDSRNVRPAFFDQALAFTVRSPRIFLRLAWHPQHRPRLVLSSSKAHEVGQELPAVNAIGLRPPLSPVHFHARRIDHTVLNAVGHQKPMQPEPISTGLIAAQHRRVLGQSEARTRALNHGQQRRPIAGVNLIFAYARAAVGHRHTPPLAVELESHKQSRVASYTQFPQGYLVLHLRSPRKVVWLTTLLVSQRSGPSGPA